jgi:dienelactone hydrolase
MIRAWATMSVLLALASGGAAAEAPPAEAFANLPQTSQAVMSPDGKLLAWQDETDTAPQVVIFDIERHQISRVVRVETGAKLRGLIFGGNSTLLSTMSFTAQMRNDPHEADQYEYWRTLAINTDGGEKRELLMEGGVRRRVTTAHVLLWNVPKPNTVMMSTMDFNPLYRPQRLGTRIDTMESPWGLNLYAVDAQSGNGSLLERGTRYTAAYVLDRNGEPVARTEWHARDAVFNISRREEADWKVVFHSEQVRGPVQVSPVSPDAKSVLAIYAVHEGPARAWSVPLDGGAPSDLLPDVSEDIDSFVGDPNSGTPIGVRLGGLSPRRHWLDPQLEAQYQRIAKPFPGRDVYVGGHALDFSRAVAVVEGPSSPPVYYLIDFGSHKADIVGEAYPALAKVNLGQAQAIAFAARDGTSIPAILTVPPGIPAKNLPLVVLPHDGPGGHDQLVFDWWTQFLATRGYAVLQPQFRGSTGFGGRFEHAGHGQWGGLMQDDVTDGVKAMVAQGIADARRICIVGRGYAGYVALAGVAFTPELYACAASINGISDLPDMLGFMKEHYGAASSVVSYWREDIGSSFDPQLAQRSPARAADRIRAPVLLMHSADDTVVPPSQTGVIANALQKAGRNVTVVTLLGDDHWLSRASTRIQMLKELDQFLAANLH